MGMLNDEALDTIFLSCKLVALIRITISSEKN